MTLEQVISYVHGCPKTKQQVQIRPVFFPVSGAIGDFHIFSKYNFYQLPRVSISFCSPFCLYRYNWKYILPVCTIGIWWTVWSPDISFLISNLKRLRFKKVLLLELNVDSFVKGQFHKKNILRINKIIYFLMSTYVR